MFLEFLRKGAGACLWNERFATDFEMAWIERTNAVVLQKADTNTWNSWNGQEVKSNKVWAHCEERSLLWEHYQKTNVWIQKKRQAKSKTGQLWHWRGIAVYSRTDSRSWTWCRHHLNWAWLDGWLVGWRFNSSFHTNQVILHFYLTGKHAQTRVANSRDTRRIKKECQKRVVWSDDWGGGVRFGEGFLPPQWGGVWAGLCPSPENFFKFLSSK